MDSDKPDLDAALRELAAEERRRLGAEHPDPDALLAYQRGELPAAEAERVRDHLALCRECGDLVLDFAAFPALEPPEGSPRLDRREIGERWRDLQAAAADRGPLWTRSKVVLPLAAAFLLAVVGLGAWNLVLRQRLERAAGPQGDVVMVVLNPESRVIRGVSPQVVAIPATAERVVVNLAVGEPRDFPGYAIDLTDGAGVSLVRDLPVQRAPSPNENFSPELPAWRLAPGEYRIELYGVRDGARERLERYSFRVTRPGP